MPRGLSDFVVVPGDPNLPPTLTPAFPGFFLPDSILPDSVLPPALQRSNTFLQKIYYLANQWDNLMLREAAVWKWIQMNGGLKVCCRIPELGAPVWDIPPFVKMPSNGLPLEKMFSALQSSFTPGVDQILGEFRVPIGYDGNLNRVVFQYLNGTGFDEFSGNIIWRCKVGIRYAKDLGEVTNTYGDFQNAFIIPGHGIRLISGQTVQLIAQVPAGSPIAGGAIAAGAFGWLYPRR